MEAPDLSLRDTILKCVQYVLRNGDGFEAKLQDDDKFAFTRPGHKYYDYYKSLLDIHKRQQEEEEEAGGEPREPYPFMFSNYDKNVTKRDLEIIKVVAQFVVVNEEYNYLDKMKESFNEDRRYDFLQEEHPLHAVFQHFIKQYQMVLTGTINNVGSRHAFLRRCFQRAEYMEYSKNLQKERMLQAKDMKMQFAAYDWTRFKTVFKIEALSQEENLPEPLDFDKLRLKTIDYDRDLVLFKDKVENFKKRKLKVKAAGETRLKKPAVAKKMIKCPITNKMIPEDRFDKHLHVLLADPRYKETKEKYEAQHKLTNLTEREVFENIKRIAQASQK